MVVVTSIASDKQKLIMMEEQGVPEAETPTEWRSKLQRKGTSCISSSRIEEEFESKEDDEQINVQQHSEIQLVPQDLETAQVTLPTKTKEKELGIDELLQVIGQSLTLLAERSGSRIPCKAFQGASVPSITVPDYLKRLVRYLHAWRVEEENQASTTKDCVPLAIRALVMSMVYIDRICEKNPGFTVTRMNVHRLCLVAFLACVKFTEDVPFPNSYWARVGGIPVEEMNRLESQFFSLINFDVAVRQEQFFGLLDRFKTILA